MSLSGFSIEETSWSKSQYLKENGAENETLRAEKIANETSFVS